MHEVNLITKHWNYSIGEYEYSLWHVSEGGEQTHLQYVSEDVGKRNAEHYQLEVQDSTSE